MRTNELGKVGDSGQVVIYAFRDRPDAVQTGDNKIEGVLVVLLNTV
jgi:hypothetical protein